MKKLSTEAILTLQDQANEIIFILKLFLLDRGIGVTF